MLVNLFVFWAVLGAMKSDIDEDWQETNPLSPQDLFESFRASKTFRQRMVFEPKCLEMKKPYFFIIFQHHAMFVDNSAKR